jgi:phage nucleotide-binding protein
MVEIKKTSDIQSFGIFMLLYGVSNSGKTHACGTLKEGETIFLDSEKSTTTLKSKNHDVVHFSHEDYHGEGAYKKLLDSIRSVYALTHNYKNVVVDTLTEFESIAVNALTSEMGFSFPRLKEYGSGAIFVRQFIRSFRSLCQHGINVIFTANERVLDRERSSNTTSTIIVPEFTQNLALSCGKMFDIVGRMRYNPSSGNRGIMFDGSDSTYLARSRFNLGQFAEPDLPKLFSDCRNGNTTAKEAEDAKRERTNS